MSGLNRHTGRSLDGTDHLSQSVTDILTTPVGSRVYRRDYGSELPRLIDNPTNGQTAVDLIMASAEALAMWEPRYHVQRVLVERTDERSMHLSLLGTVAGEQVAVEVSV